MADRGRPSRGLEDGGSHAKPEHRKLEHRRKSVRFEVVGRIAGSVASMETLHVVNLGASGALVESALPLTPNAEFSMQLVLDGHVSEATAKVRRVTETRREDGVLRYRIGLEFLVLSAEAEQVIQQLVAVNQAQA